MRAVDFIVVGQGIAGTLISYELLQAGRSVLVFDQPGITHASRVAGAIINPFNINTWEPVTNSRLFIPSALDTYRHLQQLTGQSVIEQKPMLLFSPGKNPLPAQKNDQLHNLGTEEQKEISGCFHPTELLLKLDVWQIQTGSLLDAWRAWLKKQDILLKEPFDSSLLQEHNDAILYGDIQCKAVIYCEGAAADKNPYFSGLPFTKNRGEVLLLRIPGLPTSFVYHHKLRLIPTDKVDIFWCGSNYTWRFNNLQPGDTWRNKTLDHLASWLKLSVTLTDHIAAERPTTGGQEPMVGAHPAHPRIYIFNGLGTKGYSLGPFLAKQLSRHLVQPETAGGMQLVRPLSIWI